MQQKNRRKNRASFSHTDLTSLYTDEDFDQFITNNSDLGVILEENTSVSSASPVWQTMAKQQTDNGKVAATSGDSQCLVIALSIYHKIDTTRRGYIDRAMLRAYTERILRYV